jgi:hypothetical protein
MQAREAAHMSGLLDKYELSWGVWNGDLEHHVQEVPQLPVSRYGVGRPGIVPMRANAIKSRVPPKTAF